jgi:hypothetical protein
MKQPLVLTCVAILLTASAITPQGKSPENPQGIPRKSSWHSLPYGSYCV